MSDLTDRLSEDDFRELARLIRGIHARWEAKRERLERERQAETLDEMSDCESLAGMSDGHLAIILAALADGGAPE